MINTYKRAKYARKMITIATVNDRILSSMDTSAKLARINSSTMSYRARLAATQAVSVSSTVCKVW